MNEITTRDNEQALTMREEFGGRTREITVNEIDVQIATAKRYPRSVGTAILNAKSVIGSSMKIAESCWYRLPRGGGIEGYSVRLAEIAVMGWGNIRYGCRVLSADDKFVFAEGICHDLERNVVHQCVVHRRITDKNGKRYRDDMVQGTGQAAASIAARNAVFRVIPRSIIEELADEARRVARGDEKTLPERRKVLVDYFTRGLKVPIENVLAAIDRVKVEDIDLDDMLTLRGMANEIKEGQRTALDVFPPPMKNEKPEGGMSLGKGRKPKAEAEAPPPPADDVPPPAEDESQEAPEPKADPDDLKRQLSDLAFQCYPDKAMSVKRSMIIREACGVPMSEAGLAALEYGLRVLTALAGRFGQGKPTGDDQARAWVREIKNEIGD